MPEIAETVPDSLRNRAAWRPKPYEILEHRHAALEERHVVAEGAGLADRRHVGGDAGQPDVEQVARGVRNQRVVLVGPHPGVRFGRLEVLEGRVVRDFDAGDRVVPQPDRLDQSHPAVDHVAHDGVPVVIGRTAAGGEKGLFIVAADLLRRHAAVLGRELRHERPDGNPVRLLVPHGGDIPLQPRGVAIFDRLGSLLGGTGHGDHLGGGLICHEYGKAAVSRQVGLGAGGSGDGGDGIRGTGAYQARTDAAGTK